MKKRVFVSFCFILLIATGCESPTGIYSESKNIGEVSVSEFVKNAKRLNGEKVIVNGYLNASGPGLYLSIDERGAPARGDDIVFILDPDIHFTIGNEGYTVDGKKRNILCTNRFVKINGIAGFIDEYRLIGIKYVSNITTYNDPTKDIGELCYKKASRAQ